MQRRKFLLALLAPFVARSAPKPKMFVGVDLASGPDTTGITLTALDEYTHKYIVPRTADAIFTRSPLFERLCGAGYQFNLDGASPGVREYLQRKWRVLPSEDSLRDILVRVVPDRIRKEAAYAAV